MDSQVNDKAPASETSTPWNQDFMNMFGFGVQEVNTKVYGRGSASPSPAESFFQSVWDAFSPRQIQPVAPPNQGRGKVNPDTMDTIFSKMIDAESRGKHRDSSGNLTTSPVGAQGITQVMPKTGRDPGYGVKPLKDDSEAEYIRFGKDLFHAYTKEFGGDVRKGVAAYNHGIGAVQRAVAKYGDEWEAKLPAETKKYLKTILGGMSSAQAADYGNRPDGTKKGDGFLGPLKAKDGSTMTEFSVGVNIGGVEMDIPTFVPTLTRTELNSMLNGKAPSDAIVQKAVDHARQRIEQGLSPFAQKGEKPQKVK